MPSLREKSDLRTYQVFMARAIKRIRTLLLAVDMGLGKTAAVLTAARRLLDEFMVRRILIIAPLYVAEETWPEEIAAWRHTKALSYSVITGTPKQRLAALMKDVEVYIINRENLPWLLRALAGKRNFFDMIVYDESSRLKGGKHRTKRGKGRKGGGRMSEFGALAKISAEAEYIVEMSGTPAPGGLQDLWGQIFILDKGERLGSKRADFINEYFDKDYMGWNIEPKPAAEKKVMRRIADVMVGLRAEDHLELPPLIRNVIPVRLPKRIMEEYKRFEKTLVSDTYDVEAASRGVLTNKLLQFANGSMYRDLEDSWPKKREVVEVHDAKMAALESVIAEAAGASVLLAYSFKFDLRKILKKYPKASIVGDDPDWKKKWDKGRTSILAAHPAQIGHGLNLQYGGHIICWYGMNWSLELYQQLNRRLTRPGQPHPFVTAHHLLAVGTCDYNVYEAMGIKGATQDRITEAVRRRILTV